MPNCTSSNSVQAGSSILMWLIFAIVFLIGCSSPDNDAVADPYATATNAFETIRASTPTTTVTPAASGGQTSPTSTTTLSAPKPTQTGVVSATVESIQVPATPTLAPEPQATATVVAKLPVPTVTETSRPILTPEPLSSPTSTPVPNAGPTVFPMPTAMPTPTAVPTPSVLPSVSVSPTAFATPPSTPQPTPAPTTTIDPFIPNKSAGSMSGRYGLVTHSEYPGILDWILSQTGAEQYIHFTSKVDYIPAGKTKLIFIEVEPARTVLTPLELSHIATKVPGGTWYVSGEPNVRYAVDDLIEDLKYYYDEIKAADPTAVITSPSILNWEFTCIGCGGYTSGKAWMESFVARYQDLYGELPPWDAWAMDVYPLDWFNLPNTGFLPETIEAYAPNLPPPSETIAAQQISDYRNYIDSLAGRSGDPIIVTEIGIHWGWTGLEFISGCESASPTGEYKPLVLRDYLDSIYTWLENNAVAKNIESWFTYTTYSDVSKCRYDGYSGLSLFNSPDAGSALTDLGRWYALRSAR